MIKKLIFILVLMLCASTVLSCGKNDGGNDTGYDEKEYQYNNFVYVVGEEGITITGYLGIDTTITFPSEIEGKPVVEIRANAFRGCVGLNNVIIPDGIIRINGAFVNCTDLKSVSIGKTVSEMEEAFSGCSTLKNISGCEGAERLCAAFRNCASLSEAFIPSSAVDCFETFSGCVSLSNVEIRDGVTLLDSTFKGCTYLKSVTVPSSVAELVGTFFGCTSLEIVNGLDNVTRFVNTFSGCVSLENITLGEYVTDMDGAFTDCIALKNVVNCPREVETWSPCFGGCSSLDFIRIPVIRNAESLAEYDALLEFKGCSALETVIIDSNIPTDVSFRTVFADCPLLKVLTLTDETMNSFVEVGYVYSDEIYTGTNLKILNNAKSYANDSGVRSVSGYATIDGKDYSHVSGGDINGFDPDKEAEGLELTDFVEYEKVVYWVGYQTNGKRSATMTSIKRTYLFCACTTGIGGNCPETVYINGVLCH